MSRTIYLYLDTGPLGRISNPNASRSNRRHFEVVCKCRGEGIPVVVPEIADYEVRRELTRVGATAGLARLDLIRSNFQFAPITSEVMLKAAELWAEARRCGKPTAAPEALDGDVILAAQAIVGCGEEHVPMVITDNVGHLSRYVEAMRFDEVFPSVKVAAVGSRPSVAG